MFLVCGNLLSARVEHNAQGATVVTLTYDQLGEMNEQPSRTDIFGLNDLNRYTEVNGNDIALAVYECSHEGHQLVPAACKGTQAEGVEPEYFGVHPKVLYGGVGTAPEPSEPPEVDLEDLPEAEQTADQYGKQH